MPGCQLQYNVAFYGFFSTDLMGKPGPNTNLCPCLTEPSKKASPPERPGKLQTFQKRV
jgi:hypothetical protein